MCTFIGLTDLTIVSFLDFQIQKGVFVISGHKMEPNVEMTYMYKDSEGGAFEPIKIFPIFFHQKFERKWVGNPYIGPDHQRSMSWESQLATAYSTWDGYSCYKLSLFISGSFRSGFWI